MRSPSSWGLLTAFGLKRSKSDDASLSILISWHKDSLILLLLVSISKVHTYDPRTVWLLKAILSFFSSHILIGLSS